MKGLNQSRSQVFLVHALTHKDPSFHCIGVHSLKLTERCLQEPQSCEQTKDIFAESKLAA